MKNIIIAALALSLLSGCVLTINHHDHSRRRDHSNTSMRTGKGHANTKGFGDASRAESAPAPRTALINHVVFFKLNDPAKANALVTDCDKLLAGIPSVTSYFCGTHLETGRESVDDNYDVGLYVGFDSKEGYSAYLTHPDHLALVEKWLPDFEWIQVRDVSDGTP